MNIMFMDVISSWFPTSILQGIFNPSSSIALYSLNCCINTKNSNYFSFSYYVLSFGSVLIPSSIIQLSKKPSTSIFVVLFYLIS